MQEIERAEPRYWSAQQIIHGLSVLAHLSFPGPQSKIDGLISHSHGSAWSGQICQP